MGRVKRLSFLSIFFIMHLLISLAGGGSGLLFSFYMLYSGRAEESHVLGISALIGVVVTGHGQTDSARGKVPN